LPLRLSTQVEAAGKAKRRGAVFALLHGFSHVHRPASPTLVPYHLATLARPHTHQKSALAIPLDLTLAMIFHALSPILNNQPISQSKYQPELYTNPLKKETKTDTPQEIPCLPAAGGFLSYATLFYFFS